MLKCFLWNVLPEDNCALEFYNYLVHCQMLGGVIEFSISFVQCVKVRSVHSRSYSSLLSGLCELSAKCRKRSMCENLTLVMVTL